VNMRRLLGVVSQQIPSLDSSQVTLPLHFQLPLLTATSDPKALMFVLQNTLSYALNATRRRMLELSGRMKRKVHASEFRPMTVTVRPLAVGGKRVRGAAPESSDFFEIVISFVHYNHSKLCNHNPGRRNATGDECTTSAGSSDTGEGGHSEREEKRLQAIEQAIRDEKRPFDVEIASILLDKDTQTSGGDNGVAAGVSPKSRVSSILYTSRQMLESRKGSLRLIEMPLNLAALANGPRRPARSGDALELGGECVIVIQVPCASHSGSLERDAQEISTFRFMEGEPEALSTNRKGGPPLSSCQLGFAVQDDDLCRYGMKMFHSCNVSCFRIPFDNLRMVDTSGYLAIVTDSLTTYSQLRMRGFLGKVVVMSTFAVYIDGISNVGQKFDYALSVPCDATDVYDLVRALTSKEKAHRPTSVSLQAFRPQLFRRFEKTLNSFINIPFAYFILQVIRIGRKMSSTRLKRAQQWNAWLAKRAWIQHTVWIKQTELETELSGQQYTVSFGIGPSRFRPDVEGNYCKLY
jgi:hypothetical protein